MTDFRLPNITAKDPQGQIKQMQSFMYQLTEQLNMALKEVEKQADEVSEVNAAASGEKTQEEALGTFNSIKALIIKSADIIEAYSEELRRQYDSLYVAQSDYGTFKEQTQQQIIENASSITQLLANIQTIQSDLQAIISTQAYIRSGILDYGSGGIPIIGVEVGQETTENGSPVFNKFARFTAEGVYFYLMTSPDPVAWMSGQKLYITFAQITGGAIFGDYIIDLSDGMAFK